MSKKESKVKKPVHPFRGARRAGVPLLVYETGDPWATITQCQRALNGKEESTPLVQWDCLRGFQALNQAGQPVAANLGGAEVQDCAMALASMGAMQPSGRGAPVPVVPENTICFMHNAQRFLDDSRVIQGLCNLRNPWKGIGASVVLLGPGYVLPPELKDDMIVIEEPNPTEADIARVIDSTLEEAAKSCETFKAPEDKQKVTDTLLGYRAEFGVEQSLALSVTADGVDLEKLWGLKVAALKQTAGLEVTLPREGFESLAGCSGVKDLFTKLLNGREEFRPRAVLWLDEIEKMVAGGSGGDLSGTTQALVEQFLFWTEAQRVKGCLLLGVPGAGKSATCKAVAGQAKVPLLRASMSTVKGSLVGQSEQQMKNLLRAVDAVSQGRVLMLATCNSVDALTPELMARFKLASFFYDFPDQEERAAIWSMYQSRFECTSYEPPPSDNWVGREIESCCERSYMFNCPLTEAAKSVVPVAVSNQAKLEALRRNASGRFLSAAHPGPFEYREAVSQFYTGAPTGRKLRVD